MIKIGLELVLNENGNNFLNFWDSYHGNDVTAQIIDGKLFKAEIVNDGVEYTEEVSLTEFIALVKKSVGERKL